MITNEISGSHSHGYKDEDEDEYVTAMIMAVSTSETSVNFYQTCTKGLKKTTRSLSHNSWPPGQDMNQRRPEYKAEVLITLLQHSIANMVTSDDDK
jgi:hypothetical protein